MLILLVHLLFLLVVIYSNGKEQLLIKMKVKSIFYIFSDVAGFKRLLNKDDDGELEKGKKQLAEVKSDGKKGGIRFGGLFGSKAPSEEANNQFGNTQSSLKKEKPGAEAFGSTKPSITKSSQQFSEKPKKKGGDEFGVGNSQFHGKSKTSADAFGR